MAIDNAPVSTRAMLSGDILADITMLCDEIDRLRAEAKPTPQQQEGKTVKVRVAVAVDKDGDWSASGWTDANDPIVVDDAMEYFEGDETLKSIYWLTATLPVPEEKEVEATVENG